MRKLAARIRAAAARWTNELCGWRKQDELLACRMSRRRLARRMFSRQDGRNSKPFRPILEVRGNAHVRREIAEGRRQPFIFEGHSKRVYTLR